MLESKGIRNIDEVDRNEGSNQQEHELPHDGFFGALLSRFVVVDPVFVGVILLLAAGTFFSCDFVLFIVLSSVFVATCVTVLDLVVVCDEHVHSDRVDDRNQD
jgi:hypothetical protein